MVEWLDDKTHQDLFEEKLGCCRIEAGKYWLK